MSEAVVGKLSKALAADAVGVLRVGGHERAGGRRGAGARAFDAVVLDMQHGALDFAGASRAILAVALADKPSIVRVPVGEFPAGEPASRCGRGRDHRADDQQPR